MDYYIKKDKHGNITSFISTSDPKLIIEDDYIKLKDEKEFEKEQEKDEKIKKEKDDDKEK